MEIKTNVMRILDKQKIRYTPHFYDNKDGRIDGVAVAEKIGKPTDCVFKTLVTRGQGGYYVFCIPVDKELDLKKCARAAGVKSVEMIAVKEMLSVTGYIRGGCSPVGMKKQFVTVFHSSAMDLEEFYVSAGKVGRQIRVNPKTLCEFVGAKFENIIV